MKDNPSKIDGYEQLKKKNAQLKSEIAKLRAEQRMFQALLDNYPSNIYFKDTNFNFVKINQAQASLLGLKNANDAIGTNDSDYFTQKHATNAVNDEKHIIRTGEAIINKLEKIRNAKGRYRWVSTTKVPTYDQQNNINGIVGISVDVTDKRNAEINLERALLKAEEADRLKSAFLANMSHDIRTPMNGIVGFADLLRSPVLSDEQRDKYTNHIIKSGNILLHLIDDIIDISKIEAGQLKMEKKPVLINQVLEEEFELFKNEKKYYPKATFEFKLQKGIDDARLSILTDPIRFKQILTNLLSNAFKFTKEGAVEMGYELQGKFLEFYVKDTGIGIPENYHAKIFERFGQVEETRKLNTRGTGLGLAITTNLVNYLGGEIRLESKINEGSAFYFTLPFDTTSSYEDDINLNSNDENEYNWSNKLILIAEDEDINFLYLNGALLNTGARIIRAKNGKEAIATAATRDDIDIVLMDIKMPFVNGYEATRAIKQFCPDLPVIAQTAFVMEDEKTKCYDAGCDYYLSKPIKKETLYKVLNSYFNQGTY